MRSGVALLMFIIFLFLKLYLENPGERKSRAHKVMSAECVIEPSIEIKKTQKNNGNVFTQVKNVVSPFTYPCDSATEALKSVGRHLNKKIRNILK